LDPVSGCLLARRLFPHHQHHAPIDSGALTKYRFFQKIGLFPVQQNARAGAAHFLRTSSAILHANRILWITAQGAFTDVRQRPATLRPGIAHLARAHPHIPCIPLAVEYPFWNERLPEILLTFGKPTRAAALPELESALESTQNKLAAAAQSRNPALFHTLLRGRGGAHPLYDTFRKSLALLRRRPLNTNHEDPTP
jgi:1-acyl-sn-glycerol-3-phosphate acyltransferase